MFFLLQWSPSAYKFKDDGEQYKIFDVDSLFVYPTRKAVKCSFDKAGQGGHVRNLI